jgi:hypothetical protein
MPVSPALPTVCGPLTRGPRATQVEEEAGILRTQLELACLGRPLDVVDGARHFRVHPFLLRLKRSGGDAAVVTPRSEPSGEGDDPAVRLNWENTDHRWVDAA